MDTQDEVVIFSRNIERDWRGKEYLFEALRRGMKVVLFADNETFQTLYTPQP